MKYKALIFDLDGTLLNTLDDLADSANHILGQLGFPTHSTDKYKYFVGNGIPKLIERCLPADRQDCKEKALSMFVEYYSLHSEDKTAAYDGIPELLSAAKRKGLKLGVITNKAHSIAQQVVPHFLGGGVFDYIRGLDETIKAKPCPNGALDVADKLGVKPDEVLYIGDSGVDMQTAVNAGFTPCGVLWGFRTREELLENGAVYFAEKPSDILELI
ncbi:MAG: HAD family hydrolase [Ruminiclostridium sp.]